ncbi:hypothetical protein FOZ61_010476 [Perkinsus olseni]|uniref:Uncharacterized protein n=1 Tax=Perkinsus olseni TaxID=32597 RepID=A0A7J6KWY4_PEROL|nr:hypothetical protein FOZ61_010476 [Perkinsus olseni]KAF4652907.1 hypothetical protein FOL46_009446 [Perkinsus olseni]
MTSRLLITWRRIVGDSNLRVLPATIRRGKHSKVRTPLFDAEYQGYRERFRHHVKANSIGKDGSPNLTADALAEWVNSEMELGEGDKYSNRTILRWLPALGFSVHSVKNTLYVDGHEREVFVTTLLWLIGSASIRDWRRSGPLYGQWTTIIVGLYPRGGRE